MVPIHGLKCIYATGSKGWAIELMLGGEGDQAVRRFEVDGPEDAEMLIEAFDQSTSSTFDPVSGEIVFAYEYADYDDEDDLEDEDEDESEDLESEDEDDEDEDEKVKA